MAVGVGVKVGVGVGVGVGVEAGVGVGVEAGRVVALATLDAAEFPLPLNAATR